MFIWCQSVLVTAEKISENHCKKFYLVTANKEANIMSWTASCGSYHYLLICAPAQGFFKALGSVSEATILKRQRVHLILVTRRIFTC